jgi:type IV fimbrial biogenesis protein FimT
MKTNRFNTNGFTIIELLITMSIAAILLSIGVPSFQTMVKDSRIREWQKTIEFDLEMAKSEAMTRNQSVILCRHDGETATPTACDNAAAWKDGWVIFVDANGDTKVDTTELLRVTKPEAANLELSYSNATITFNSRGFVGGAGGTLGLCDDRGYLHGMKLVISSSGFIQTGILASQSEC